LGAVTDTGIGMATDMIVRAVKPFVTQLGWKDSLPGPIMGSGLGILIVKGQVDTDGREKGDSKRSGQGTRISFTLPRRDVLTELILSFGLSRIGSVQIAGIRRRG